MISVIKYLKFAITGNLSNRSIMIKVAIVRIGFRSNFQI